MGDGYRDIPDTETASYRAEQGKPAEPDPRERMGDVPIAFSSGGVLAAGVDERLGPETGEVAETADATRAIERGAAEIERERREA